MAREQEWSYERFLETLLEAEVFARDASGARMRIRHAAFPALKTLEDFDWSAQPSAERPLVLHLAQLAWIEEHGNVCFLDPLHQSLSPGTRSTFKDFVHRVRVSHIQFQGGVRQWRPMPGCHVIPPCRRTSRAARFRGAA